MQSNSQRRAQARNVTAAAGQEAIYLRGALEIHTLFPEHAKAESPTPTPVSRPSVDHSILSPNGRVSKRSKDVAMARTREALFGPGGLQRPQVAQPSEAESLRRQAAELRRLAAGGMKPRAYAKKAAELEQRAAALEPTSHAETFAEAPDPFAAFADPVRVQPPALAVEHFRRLVPSLSASTVRYGPLLDRHAFTLAVAADQVLLEKVQAAILAQLEGATGDATADVQAILDAAGVSHRNPQYANQIVRTNVMASLNEGSQAELADPDMQEEFPVFRYEGIRDGRQGPDHEPHFDRYYPSTVTFGEVRGPRVWNCRCSMTPVHKSEWAELERQGVRLESRW
jgi:hypothetical protein